MGLLSLCKCPGLSLLLTGCIVLCCNLSHLVVLGKHGIGKGVKRQCALIICVNNSVRQCNGAWNLVDGCNQTVALNLWLRYSGIEVFILIDFVVASDIGVSTLSVAHSVVVVYGFVTHFVQKVESSHTDKNHLQNGIPDEHTCHDTG